MALMPHFTRQPPPPPENLAQVQEERKSTLSLDGRSSACIQAWEELLAATVGGSLSWQLGMGGSGLWLHRDGLEGKACVVQASSLFSLRWWGFVLS